MARRTYSSPLRERQAQQTRNLILDALTDLLESHRADEVTTRELAQAAAVSERTVYRHFPDREALLRGLSERLTKLTGNARRDSDVQSVDDLPKVALSLMAGLDQHHAAARAEALFNADPRRFSESTKANTQRFRQLVAEGFPDLDEQEQVRVAAVIRCLLSAQAWLRMREEFGVPGVQSGPAVAWVIETIIEQLRQGKRPG